MLNKIIKLIQYIQNQGKSATSSSSTTISVSDNGVIDISHLSERRYTVPGRLQESQNIKSRNLDGFKLFDDKAPSAQITNNKFKSISLLNNLSIKQAFYLDSLDLSYGIKFENIEFLEIQAIKLFLDLCEQTDLYLRPKGSSLEKIGKNIKDSWNKHFLFNGLYSISAICIERYYYGRSWEDTKSYFRNLQYRVDDQIMDYLNQYLAIRIPTLPTVPESSMEQVYSNLDAYHILGLAFKRLDLSDNQTKLLEIIQFNKNIFIEIDQCLDETILLCLMSISFVLEKCRESDRKSVLKAFDYKPKKSEYGGYLHKDHRLPVSKTLQSIFSICQNHIRVAYKHSRLEDISHNKGYLTRKLGKKISQELEDFIHDYQPQTPTKVTQIKLNAKNKTKWKDELKDILHTSLDLQSLKQKCDELIDLNSKNVSQYLIYFELCKHFAYKNKTASMWYYYKYYEYLVFSPQPAQHLSDPKPLPKSIVKIIFDDDSKKLEEFISLCNTKLSINKTDDFVKISIKRFFEVKRKELKLSVSETQKAHESHYDMTTRLNQVLQEEEDINIKTSNQNMPIYTNSIIGDGINTVTLSSNSVTELFSSGATTLNRDVQLEYSEIEMELIYLFRVNQFELNDEQVSIFANSRSQLKNSLIKKINQKFYEIYEENLIDLENEIYSISKYNQKLI